MPSSLDLETGDATAAIEAMTPPSERSSISGTDWIDNEKYAAPEREHDIPVHTQFQVGQHGRSSVIRVSLGPDSLNPKFSLHDFCQRSNIDTTNVSAHKVAASEKFQSPFDWAASKKMIVLSGAFMASFLAAYSAGAYALAAEPLRKKWHVTDTEYNIGITLFVAGFGFTPMVLAPVSEAYGRYWVFVGSGLVFFFGTLGCSVTSSYPGMLVSRLVTGCGAAVYAALTGGVVSDLYHKANRNTPMTLYSLSIMFGTGLGPLVSGAVVDNLGWHWIFYLQLIAIGFTTATIFFFFEETRSNVLLVRKCQLLNEMELRTTSGSRVLFIVSSGQAVKVDISIIWTSFGFPLRLLATESVVFWFSVWISFAWSILYMQFSSIGFVFRGTYGFTSTEVGAVYTAVIVGAILGTVLAIIQEPITRMLLPSRLTATNSPEQRLLSPCIQSIFLPIGLFWLGWTARPDISWVSPALAIGSCTLGIFSIYLACFNYVADTYHRYASSAIAAQSMCRNLLAGIFPLITSKMLTNLTVRGAGSLLGGLGVLLTIIPWLLFFFGRRIRARSPFARELQDS